MRLRRKFENLGIMAAPAMLGLGFLVLHHTQMPWEYPEPTSSATKAPVAYNREGVTANQLPPQVEKLLHQSHEYTDPYGDLADKIACYMAVIGPLGAWAMLGLRKPEEGPTGERASQQDSQNVTEQVAEGV